MNRILSVETSRSGVLASEFVSKRLCCSLIFTVAFLALLGGYLLGQFSSDRTAVKLRANYQEVNKKIGALNELLKNTFQNKCNFTSPLNDTVLATNSEMLDEVIKCFQNG